MVTHSLSAHELADWARGLSASLRAGIPMKQALKQASDRGSSRSQRASEAILHSLENGQDVAGAFQENARYFPSLFVGMLSVGVQTGHIPEVLRELERYYRFQLTLRRKFLQQITWPGIQLVLAIFIIAFVIWLMGILPVADLDILGLGLRGFSGAIVWLIGWGMLLAVVFIAYRWMQNNSSQGRKLDQWLLKIPVLGTALRTFALSRLSMAMGLTLDSGMSVKKAILLAFDASDSPSLSALGRSLSEDVGRGTNIAAAFEQHQIFPPEFVDIINNAEETGQLPEAMKQIASEYSERAEHQFSILNQVAGWLVWMIVAGIIIFFIFRIFTVAYLNPLNDAINGRF